jgi:hypothetical protein
MLGLTVKNELWIFENTKIRSFSLAHLLVSETLTPKIIFGEEVKGDLFPNIQSNLLQSLSRKSRAGLISESSSRHV